MKWIGQHIYDLIARFRNDVYLEDISTGTIASGGNLGLDSNNKIVKNTVSSGTTDLTSDVTGTLPVGNGGTGTTSYLDNQIIAYNSSAGKLEGHNLFFSTVSSNVYKLQIGDGSSTSAILSSDNSSPLAITVDLASGANVAGSDLTLTAGLSTGTAAGGNIIFRSSSTGSSGSIPNTNSELVRITGAGNVGIGTTSPLSPLHIETADDAVIRLTSTDNKAYIALSDNDTNGYISSENSKLSLGANVGVNANNFNIDLSNNKVGIGTSSPDSLLEISSSSATDFLKLTSGGGSATPVKLIFEKSGAEQGIIEYNRNGDLEIYNTDGDGGVMIDGSASAGGDLYVNNAGNVGIGTTSPGEKLEVDGNIKVSGNLDIGGSVQKQIQVFPMNFVDDLGTDKHFMPFVTANEQTANYQEEACMVMPADGRVVSVTVHYSQMHGSASDITVGIETSPCGQSYTNAWTVEETAVLSASASDDHHVFHFAFDNAKHFESTEKMAISIQQSVDLQNASRFFWVTAVVEYDWSTFLGGSNPGQEYTTTP